MKKIFSELLKLLPLLVFAWMGTPGNGQTATTFQTTLRNVVQTTDRTLEFDLYLLNTDNSQPMEMASYQAGITLNPAIYTGGTLTASIVAGSSTLSNLGQAPTSVTYTAANTIVKLAAKAPPGAGSGSVISQVSPGTRITRLKLTSTVPFQTNSTPDFFLAPSTAVNPSYPTAVALYVGGINTQFPVTMGVNAFVVENPVLNAPTAPAAFAVTGGGAYVQGGAGLPVGLANSEAGVTYTLYKDGVAQVPTVAGTGAAISFGNQLAGTYTVSGMNGSGTTPMTGNAIISIVSFQTTLRNIVQTSDRILEFDLYLLNTNLVHPAELASYQAGITLNSAIYAGGTLTASIVPGSSTLSNASQVPTSVTYTEANTIVKLAAKAPPGAGSGSVISQVSPGTRIIRLRLTSSVPFASNTTPNFFLEPNTALSPSYPTAVAFYVGGINTQLPVTMGVNAFVLENPVLNTQTPPTAFDVTGGGSYCQGTGGLPVGLANSEVGVTYTLYKDGVAQVPTVAGTGAAIAFGNQLAGTYTVSGTNGAGTTAMTGSAVITENPGLPASVTIAASPAGAICAGTPVTFTATPVNGGTSPTYQWYNGTTPVGTNSSTYSYVPVQGDAISVVMTADPALACVTGSPATSNTVTMTVNSLPVVNAGADRNIPSGTSVVINDATATGTAPLSYAWTPAALFVNAGVLHPTTVNLTATASYLLKVSDGNGCIKTDQLTITVGDPDVTTNITAIPNVMHGISSFSITVKITELNVVNTNGLITVIIPKDVRWSLDGGYDPSLTILGTTPLNNNMWTYNPGDPNYHIFTTESVISGGSFSNFGFRAVFNPGNTTGIYTITSQLISGSGGESKVNNNADSERLNYFPD